MNSDLTIIFPGIGRAFDGISDHALVTAEELKRRGYKVRYLSRLITTDQHQISANEEGWPSLNLRDTSELLNLCVGSSAVLVQFEQFSYGRRGYNPKFAKFFEELARVSPSTTRIIYFHESYTAADSLKRAIMFLYQRRQARKLASSAHVVLHSCALGLRRLGRFNSNSWLLPVHENIPRHGSEHSHRVDSASRSDRTFRVLVFGGLTARKAAQINRAFSEIRRRVGHAELLYAGKHGELATAMGAGTTVRLLGTLSGEELSTLMTDVDMALAPFPDGVSGRRGSFAALMKHGVPTVTTVGPLTDDYLRIAAAAGSFVLAEEEHFADEAGSLAADVAKQARIRNQAIGYFSYIPSVHLTGDVLENAIRVDK